MFYCYYNYYFRLCFQLISLLPTKYFSGNSCFLDSMHSRIHSFLSVDIHKTLVHIMQLFPNVCLQKSCSYITERGNMLSVLGEVDLCI